MSYIKLNLVAVIAILVTFVPASAESSSQSYLDWLENRTELWSSEIGHFEAEGARPTGVSQTDFAQLKQLISEVEQRCDVYESKNTDISPSQLSSLIEDVKQVESSLEALSTESRPQRLLVLEK